MGSGHPPWVELSASHGLWTPTLGFDGGQWDCSCWSPSRGEKAEKKPTETEPRLRQRTMGAEALIVGEQITDPHRWDPEVGLEGDEAGVENHKTRFCSRTVCPYLLGTHWLNQHCFQSI